jgi:hypothetical protein
MQKEEVAVRLAVIIQTTAAKTFPQILVTLEQLARLE